MAIKISEKGGERKKSPRRSGEADILIGQRVCFFRNRQSMTQTALAKRVGLTYQQIQKYENGTTRLSTARLIQFAEILEFSIDAFFEGLVDGDSKYPDPIESLRELLLEPQMIELITGFSKIRNSSARKSIVGMVEAFSDAVNR